MTRAFVAVVIGTRPEAIKMAPIVHALRDSRTLAPWVISTGQHREMLDLSLAAFGIASDVDLGVMAPHQNLSELTARTLVGMRAELERVQPVIVVVQGDTTTALAAALAGFYARIPVAHVEAGLRSGQRWSPYPEEINRRVIDQIADLLFAPTRGAASHLVDEGFRHDRIRITGNTVVDALLAIRHRLQTHPVAVPGLEALDGKRLVLVTAHRRESFGEPLLAMCAALRQIARDNPDAGIVYPVHLNPNVAGPVRSLLAHQDRIALLPPLDYLQFVSLLARAHLVLTDSGGVQEEAPTFGKPVLVLRQVTERPEGITAGVARLVGTAARDIVSEANRLLRDPTAYRAMAAAVNPYGDGTAALQIVKHLERWARLPKVA
ncbi:MAG TPA: UDP-N-acetylglucosamine 2-epimerase (non-hydrolyzing) [Kofleriaceae bacterium]|jgi:UDP-N-acetylglucosamine 2-epimerase|nr:UDP-N-acetylglucosamine 2-epimerase (non-hydrolyzing) [Kofleriaceae bacterium]